MAGVFTQAGPIADNRLPLGGDAPPAAKAIVDLTQWAKPGGEGGSGTDRGATQRGRGTGRRIGRANECANEEDGAPRAAYCCELLSSSRSRTSSDTKRSARCHASSLSPRNWKYFLNTTRWAVVSMAAIRTPCTSVLSL